MDFQLEPGSGGDLDLPAAAELVVALRRAGYSNTRARRAVLEALIAGGGRATPATLLDLGRAHHPHLGLVTVYRTLDILAGLGLVRKLHLEEGCHAYALSPAAVQAAATHPVHAGIEADGQLFVDASADAHAHHVICQRCQRVMEFDGCDIDAVIAAVERQTGFDVRMHWLEMFGLCPACQADDAQGKARQERAI